jgi:hypothetical protein
VPTPPCYFYFIYNLQSRIFRPKSDILLHFFTELLPHRYRRKAVFVPFFVSYVCFAANSQELPPVGARLNALGNSGAAFGDAFSIFSNPACMTQLKTSTIGLAVDHRYSVAGLNTASAAYTHVAKEVRLGLGLSRYGDDLLNHSRLGVAFAYRIRMVSLGGGLSVHQLSIADNGSSQNILFQMGGVAQITPKLSYGASVYNLSRARVSANSTLYYPVVMRMGLAYKPVDQATLIVEVEKQSQQKVNFKAGLEYRLGNYVFLRTGINTDPKNVFGGLGLAWKSCALDYALSFHSRLGFVHAIGLVYTFGKTPNGTVLDISRTENP